MKSSTPSAAFEAREHRQRDEVNVPREAQRADHALDRRGEQHDNGQQLRPLAETNAERHRAPGRAGHHARPHPKRRRRRTDRDARPHADERLAPTIAEHAIAFDSTAKATVRPASASSTGPGSSNGGGSGAAATIDGSVAAPAVEHLHLVEHAVGAGSAMASGSTVPVACSTAARRLTGIGKWNAPSGATRPSRRKDHALHRHESGCRRVRSDCECAVRLPFPRFARRPAPPTPSSRRGRSGTPGSSGTPRSRRRPAAAADGGFEFALDGGAAATAMGSGRRARAAARRRRRQRPAARRPSARAGGRGVARRAGRRAAQPRRQEELTARARRGARARGGAERGVRPDHGGRCAGVLAGVGAQITNGAI